MNAFLQCQTQFRAAVGAQEPVTWIEVNGARLAVMRRGRGKPVLCLHAIGHGARDFEPLANLIGDTFEIIALDWPNQGLSQDDGQAPTAAHYEEVLKEAMDALKLESAILIGNSIGGAAALRLAASAPERVEALVLCDSGGLLAVTPITRFMFSNFIAFFKAGERRAHWFAPAFRFYYRLILPRAREEAERIVASCYEIAGTLRQAWEAFARPEADIRALTPRVKCPAFVAWAKYDHFGAFWLLSRKAVRNLPDLRVQFFRGGHAPFLEDTEHFAGAFRQFAVDKNFV